MKCLFFSQPEGRDSDSRTRRCPWRSFSQGFIPEGRKTGSDRTSQTMSEPSLPPSLGSPLPNLTMSSSQRPIDLRVFSYADLKVATRNFYRGNQLGEGGFGCVYKGWIRHEIPSEGDAKMEVAVKQLNRKGQQGHKEWLAEVHFLGLVEHPNLVKLVGYCAEDDERGAQRLLVYEFMPNKSLDDHLFQRGPPVLSWNERLKIALGSARGLAYLHEEMAIQVIFRDFKTSNVLLDNEFNPKLSDFGLARQGPETGASHVSTAVVGTVGYAAPEYIQTGHLTSKSDVWSFGVVLLEMLSGRRSMDRNRPKNEQRLLDWIRPYLSDSKKFRILMDPNLEGQYSLQQAQKIASLAHQCLGKHPRTRPKMSDVVEKLKQIVEMSYIESPQSIVNSPPSVSSQSTEVLNTESRKESTSAKRRMLLFREAANLRTRVDTRAMWRLWSPKLVKA